ncbi:acyl-CoA dehydrogenase family protein [Phytohabitans suffuscus]|uniref:Acyl-CoA dehydrogenase n=1 Tax=Phytohabitans suffuscus TaxID=624315 RepID=A0A6F8YSY7_9ACTN|nr:acyl-CoA dehydrogenase family protein [Phytohabitans suffuscus]BCB89222.1 acyl-CoA dehydrogenase [Phytohabitans suffuscus]
MSRAVAGVAEALVAVDGARAVIAEEAVKADKAAAFPTRSIATLKDAGLMSAAIPSRYGGHGFDALQLSEVGRSLGTLCGSTAMIWAMHQIQLGCMEHSAEQQRELADYLRRASREQLLIASMTSEEGVGGNLRTSKAAVRQVPGGVEVAKRALTVSYAEAADSFLVTARRGPEAAAGDQVLVLVESHQATLRQTGTWDTLGMRGTCSAPQALTAVVRSWQVLRQPFSEIATHCMVPLSHILWSAVWSGIAEDAMRRSIGYTRAKLRKSTAAPDPRVAWMHAHGQMMKDSIRLFAADYAKDPRGRGLAVRANALKMRVSIDAVRIAQMALEVCGMAGYSEIGEFSVSRHLRDLYSARLMISNDRLGAVNAELLSFGDDLI